MSVSTTNPGKRGFLVLNQMWLTSELRSRGHDVTTACSYNEIFDLNIEQPTIHIDQLLSYVPHPVDTIVFHDDSGLPRILGLESCAATKVFYSVDAHHHHEWHASFAALFDLVLVAQKDYLKSFHYSDNKYWFPPWALFEMEPLAEKTRDVVFRGNMDPKLHPKRKLFFDKLQELVPVDASYGEFYEPYRSAKIVINQAVRGDLNFRVFEAMACGALLLTPSPTVGLEDLFTDGRDLVLYERDNFAVAAEKIRYFLSHEDERSRIAYSGWELVRSKHSNGARVDTLLELLNHTRRSSDPLPNVLHDLAAKVYSFSFLAHRAAKATPGQELIVAAAESLERAFTAKCILSDEELAGIAFMVAEHLREFNQEELGFRMLRAVRKARPDLLTPALIFIEQLLLSGQNKEASEIANELSDKPDELLAAVPRLIADVRKDRTSWSKT